jgi:hypothetical protein
MSMRQQLRQPNKGASGMNKRAILMTYLLKKGVLENSSKLH